MKNQLKTRELNLERQILLLDTICRTISLSLALAAWILWEMGAINFQGKIFVFSPFIIGGSMVALWVDGPETAASMIALTLVSATEQQLTVAVPGFLAFIAMTSWRGILKERAKALKIFTEEHPAKGSTT